MSKLKRFLAREDGIALATVVAMIALLTLLSIVLIDQVTAESNRAAKAVSTDSVFQAAEAGLNDYVAKLLDDPQFYDHYVANGEGTRRQCTAFSGSVCTAPGAIVAPGQVWTPGTAWFYPNGKNTWYRGTGSSTLISNGTNNFAYNLMISPPSATAVPARTYLTVVSTGCQLVVGGATCDPTVPSRAIEQHLKRTTPADFSFMYGETPSAPWGPTASTYGRIYSLGDLCHDGAAYGDLMAEGRVNRNGCYNGSNPSSFHYVPSSGGPKTYDSTTSPKPSCPAGSVPPCPLKSAVQFSTFSASLTDIKRAAALNSPSTAFDQATIPATGVTWRIVFGAGSGTNGTMQVWSCTGSSTPEGTEPTNCTSRYNGALPKNGAIYTAQDALISTPSLNSVVNGHVTVASNADIVVGGNIYYNSDPAHGSGANDDVLGMIANNNVWVAKYAPNTLEWRGAMIAENGMWSVYDCLYPPKTRGNTSTMKFIGSMATKSPTGCACTGDCDSNPNPTGGYAYRVYAADDASYLAQYNALKFLFPPWYPVLDAQSTILFREVPPSFIPPS